MAWLYLTHQVHPSDNQHPHTGKRLLLCKSITVNMIKEYYWLEITFPVCLLKTIKKIKPKYNLMNVLSL